MPLPLQRHDAAIAAALGLLVFVVRWLILDFDNEYFMHVAWAAEMIRGGRPVYDFVEPGFILQTTIAYLAMLAGGPQLAVEGALVCALLATATVATFLVCRSLGIPRWMAVVASLAAAATARASTPIQKSLCTRSPFWRSSHTRAILRADGSWRWRR